MQQLLEYIKSHKNCKYNILESKFLNQEIKDILKKYNLSFIELCYRLNHNIALNKVFICKHCKKIINYNYKKNYYSTFCSLKCAGIYNQSLTTTKEKYRQTCLSKYGTDSFSKTDIYKKAVQDKQKDIRLKVKATLLKKYGVDNYSKSNDYKQKISIIQDKMTKACEQKYGVKYYSQSEDYKLKKPIILEHSKNTQKQKYGVDNYSKTREFKDKVKRTNIERFNVDNLMKLKTYVVKLKDTCIKKYGVDNYAKTDVWKKQYQLNKFNILSKRNATLRKNNSYNKSKSEEKIYSLLLTKFNKSDIIRQYKSDLYPFACDFYIKSLDLYIEYNGHWTHGWYHDKRLGSFNKDNLEHQKILNLYESKNTKFYKNAIYVWTDLDVRKLETFKENKLNYKIFWTVREVEDWLKEI